MIPQKSFPGSQIVSIFLKIFAILLGLAGLAAMVIIAIDPTTTGPDASFEMGVKLALEIGTFVVSGTVAALVAAAGCGLDIARDTNYRVALSAQFAVAQSPMPTYPPSAGYVPPARGATYGQGVPLQ